MNNFGDKVSFIWSVADLLRGPYSPNQYKDVILPMTVLRRLDCVLEPTKQKVLDRLKQLEGGRVKNVEPILNRLTGVPFHNTSMLDLREAQGRPEQHRRQPGQLHQGLLDARPRNLRALRLRGADRQARQGGPPVPGGLEVRRDRPAPGRTSRTSRWASSSRTSSGDSTKQSNEEAGDHFTPREVIRLMVNLLFTARRRHAD